MEGTNLVAAKDGPIRLRGSAEAVWFGVGWGSVTCRLRRASGLDGLAAACGTYRLAPLNDHTADLACLSVRLGWPGEVAAEMFVAELVCVPDWCTMPRS
jgi:hypothetical protein